MKNYLYFTAADITVEPTATPVVKPTSEPLGEVIEEISSLTPDKIAKMWSDFWPSALQWVISLFIALLIYFIGKKLIKVLVKISRHAFERAKVEISVSNFLCSVIKVLAYALLLIVVAGTIGIETTSFVAILGSIGLTIGLALQGSLSNFAGGVLILLLKPFRIGDYILANGQEGTVTTIDIFYTKILSIDNKMIVLPNGALANTNITNVTNEPNRRLDLIIPIGYNDDIRQVKEELYKISQRNENILLDEPVDLFVNAYGNDAVEIAFRVWVKKENYFLVRGELLETIKYMFDEKGFTIPFHQLDVNVMNGER